MGVVSSVHPTSTENKIPPYCSVAGLPKLLGKQNKEFVELGYPAWFALITGILELVGAALMASRKEDMLKVGVYVLQTLMGGAVYTLLVLKPGPQVLAPLVTAYGLYYTLITRNYLDLNIYVACSVLGVIGGIVLKSLGPGKSGKRAH